MNQSVILMEEDHANINRALGVIRSICLQLMQGGEVPDEDFREIIEFVREYADKHHHGKEEKFLFPVMVKKLGPVGDKLVTHGMLVEHDLGRADVLSLETALNEYKKNPRLELKLDILSYAMAYAHLLQLHIEKENSVVYPFAERGLSEEDFKEINEKSQIFEDEQTAKGVQKHHLGAEALPGYFGEAGEEVFGKRTGVISKELQIRSYGKSIWFSTQYRSELGHAPANFALQGY